MKKVALIILIMLMPLVIKAKEYDVQSANIKVSFPDNWYVFTRDNIKDNEDLAKLNVTEDYMNNFFSKNNSYIDALTTNLEFVLRIGDKTDFKSLSDFPDEKVFEYAGDFGAVNSTEDYKVYVNNYKYVLINYNYQEYNILMYATVINNQWYTFSTQKKGEFTYDEANSIKRIIDSAEYTIIEQDPVAVETEKEEVIKKENGSKLKMILIYAVLVIIAIAFILNLFLLKKKKQGV